MGFVVPCLGVRLARHMIGSHSMTAVTKTSKPGKVCDKSRCFMHRRRQGVLLKMNWETLFCRSVEYGVNAASVCCCLICCFNLLQFTLFNTFKFLTFLQDSTNSDGQTEKATAGKAGVHSGGGEDQKGNVDALCD